MSRAPRLLPLLAVAVGGVVAANALSGARALPELLSAARAAAEETAKPPRTAVKAGSSAPRPAARPTLPAGASPQALSQGAGAPAPVCAPSATDLARSAGLSPAELQILQNLQARRGQIETREKDLDTEVQLLAAAEGKLDVKLKAMNALKAEIQGLMGQSDLKTQAEVDRLVVVYSKMRPQDAAAIMSQLDDRVRVPLASNMKPAVLSAILGKMGTSDARVLTERLAHRFAPAPVVAEPAAARPAPAVRGAAAKTAALDPDEAAPPDPAPPSPPVPRLRRDKPRRLQRAEVAPRRIPTPRSLAPSQPDARLPDRPQPYSAGQARAGGVGGTDGKAG